MAKRAPNQFAKPRDQIPLRLPAELSAWLASYAGQRGQSRNEVVERWLSVLQTVQSELTAFGKCDDCQYLNHVANRLLELAIERSKLGGKKFAEFNAACEAEAALAMGDGPQGDGKNAEGQ